MSDEMLICHCSPTLAGIKTGSLFSCPYSSREMLIREIRQYNQKMTKKGIQMLPVRISSKKVLIYLYRPKYLERDFLKKGVQNILEDCGYDYENPMRCIKGLMKKLQSKEEFPHEIGVFLGYPSEDVKGFIENKAMGCKCAGCWKVYGDEKAAKNLFDQYKKCKDIYYTEWKNGSSVEQLTKFTN